MGISFRRSTYDKSIREDVLTFFWTYTDSYIALDEQVAQETNNQRSTYLTSILQLPRKSNYNMVDKGRED